VITTPRILTTVTNLSRTIGGKNNKCLDLIHRDSGGQRMCSTGRSRAYISRFSCHHILLGMDYTTYINYQSVRNLVSHLINLLIEGMLIIHYIMYLKILERDV